MHAAVGSHTATISVSSYGHHYGCSCNMIGASFHSSLKRELDKRVRRVTAAFAIRYFECNTLSARLRVDCTHTKSIIHCSARYTQPYIAYSCYIVVLLLVCCCLVCNTCLFSLLLSVCKALIVVCLSLKALASVI
jgi:hypothetical protein